MTTEQIRTRISILDTAEKLAFEDDNIDNWDDNYGIIMKVLTEKIKLYKRLNDAK